MNKEEKSSNKCAYIFCKRATHKESKYCIFHASLEEKTEEEFKQALKEYINKIEKDDSDYDFNGFIFIGDMIFEKDLKINILKMPQFKGATFEGKADFEGITFKRGAKYKGITFKIWASIEGATFERVIFKKNAQFKGATFKGNANFKGATFKERADFEGTIFKKYTTFAGANFEGWLFFEGATFKGATFELNADFEGATFKGDADFRKATFGEEVVFKEATFKKDANFREANFEDQTNFDGATFEGFVKFIGATFKEDANFKLKYLVKILNFSKTKAFSGKKLSIKIINEGGRIYFERAYLENIDLNIELVKDTFIDFTGVLLKNTKIKKDQVGDHILQEEKKEFSEAQEIYLLLKNNFHSIGQYEDESWAYKKEKDMERLSYSYSYYKENRKDKAKEEKFPILKWIKKGDFKKLIISTFSNMIYGYGERPRNVIFSAIFIIILFSVFFSFLGINSPEIIEMKSPTVQEIFNSNSEIISKGNLINKTTNYYIDCLYFSAITFTTLGYGDFRPLEGMGRILAGSEAFIGAFMMALFVYTFARRTGGR